MFGSSLTANATGVSYLYDVEPVDFLNVPRSIYSFSQVTLVRTVDDLALRGIDVYLVPIDNENAGRMIAGTRPSESPMSARAGDYQMSSSTAAVSDSSAAHPPPSRSAYSLLELDWSERNRSTERGCLSVIGQHPRRESGTHSRSPSPCTMSPG